MQRDRILKITKDKKEEKKNKETKKKRKEKKQLNCWKDCKRPIKTTEEELTSAPVMMLRAL
jgi:hypothetical protein